MSKLTEKQLIESLKSLKGIKPRQEWAVLLKSQILAEKQEIIAKTPARFADFRNTFSSIFLQRKLAYSFAAVLILIAGAFTLANLPVFKKVPAETASITVPASTKQNTVALNTKINNFAAAVKNKKNISINAKELAQNLKSNPVQDSATLNAIATSLKTLADVKGADLSANADVQDLYQAVAQAQIADLQKTTLTDVQKKILANAEDLYKQGKYADALEAIYNINQKEVDTSK